MSPLKGLKVFYISFFSKTVSPRRGFLCFVVASMPATYMLYIYIFMFRGFSSPAANAAPPSKGDILI